MGKNNGGPPPEEPTEAITIEHEPTGAQPPALPPTATAMLPSEHLLHANVYENETQTRLQGFQSAILALKTQKEGAEAKHNTEVTEKETKHLSEMADLERRIVDLEEAENMALAALSAKRHEQQ